MVKSDKNAKTSVAERIYDGFTVSNIRRLIRRAVIFPVDFRRTNFRRRIQFGDRRRLRGLLAITAAIESTHIVQTSCNADEPLHLYL